VAKFSDYIKDEKQLAQAKRMKAFANENKYPITSMDCSKDVHMPRIIVTVWFNDTLPESIWERQSITHGTWYFNLPQTKENKDCGTVEERIVREYAREYKNFERFFARMQEHKRNP
jgi:hypothetical protein